MFASGFPPEAEMARLTARMLLEIRAVHFRRDEPFRLTSGLASPVYIDCRKLISYPAVRATLMDFACAKLLRDAGFARFDAVAGGETAGIPFAAWIAERLALPMLYVRKKPKGFGRDAQIEGALTEGARVLLVEDLATDGGSKLRFAEAVRAAGLRTAVVSSSANCKDVLESAGIEHLIDVRIDGLVARERGLRGKPKPDTYLEAAHDLGCGPDESAVFEDALVGMDAGRNGRFGYVVGVDRTGQAEELRKHGADTVVTDLAELLGAGA
jgi:orotate phosphoribosyltransferase